MIGDPPDVFAAPVEGGAAVEDPDPSGLVDPHLAIAAASFVLFGFQGIGLGLAMVPIGAFAGAGDPDLGSPAGGVAIGLLAFAMFGGYGALCVAGAWGVRRADPLGYGLGVVAACLVSLGCPPFGAHALFALLREPARRRFGVG